MTVDISPVTAAFKNKEQGPDLDSTEERIYDVVLDITTLDEIANQSEGWKLEIGDKRINETREWIQNHLEEKGKDREGDFVYLNEDESIELANKFLKVPQSNGTNMFSYVCVLGFFDRGKTFILNKLTNGRLPSGHRVTTKGISISIPSDSGSKFILLDTAGHNSPIGEELLDKIKNKLNLTNDIDPKDASNARERNEAETSHKLREEEIRTKIQEGAIVAKKATEQFITSLASQIADTVIFVVNELTWFDQQAIESLSKQYQQVYVIHNFKSTVDKENYLALRKKYVETIYPGAMMKVVLPGTDIPVEYWQNNSGSLTHFFLAKEGSEAADEINQGAFHQIVSLLNANVKPSRRHPIVDLIRNSAMMMENYLRGPIDDVQVRYYKNTLEVSFVASTNSKNPEEAFTMTRSQVEYDGMNLGITSAEFKPLIDMIKLDECIVVRVDIPGMVTDEKGKAYEEYDDYCEVYIDENNNLIISGRRSTFFFAYNSEAKTTKQCIGYTKTDGLGSRLILSERKGGKFSRYISIPKGFSTNEIDLSIDFFEGTLQIRIPKKLPNFRTERARRA